MPDNINVNVALDEPAVAANLDQLRYLVFEGKKGDKGDTGATGPQGPQGPQGEPGESGSGETATITLAWDSDDIYTASYEGSAITGGEMAELVGDGKAVFGLLDDFGVYVCQIVETDNALGVKFILPSTFGLNTILFGNNSSEGNASFTPYPTSPSYRTAVYGSTTASEIRAWINNGEPVRCVYDGREYWCSSVVQSGASSYRAVFACCDSALSGLTRTYTLHILEAGDTTPPTWAHYTQALVSPPVTSVNGQTGAVVIPLAQPGETHVNVLNPADAVQGYIAAQGQINNSDTYWSTGYIAVSEGDVVRVFYDGANKNHAYAAEYSTQAQSGFISRTEIGSYASYTVQHDGYVRLSVKTSAVPWANVSTAMVTINDTDSTYIAYGDLGANDGLMSAADKKKLDGLGRSAGKKVFDKFLFIAYSSFGNTAPNSVPHYEDCAQKDYDWLKADVQPTSDGGLVCCHDSGFTLDGNGRITTYNSSSATEIYTLTLAQATALTYASYPTTHVASIDDFLEVCKKYGKIPYITIRDAHMDVVVPALMAALDKFALRSVAVINSSTRASLDAVRTADKDITMSLFMNPFGSSMASGYNYCIADGNTMLGFFYTQSSHTWAEFIASSTIAGYIDDCIENGIIMWAGIESDASHVDDLIAMGFSGIHTMQDRPSPIPTKTSDLANDSGFQTAAQVQTAVSGKADKALRVAMTASDTTPTLDPNKLYVFPEMASLTPTFTTPTDNTIVNEYHFIFDSGATATVLTLPATILQPDGFTVEANMHYEISILEGAMTAQGWAVSA